MGAAIAKISPQSSMSQMFPPKSKFDPARDIPDLTGKVIIVTGGNAGVGYHIVKQLLLKNAKVYLAARSPARCSDAIERLKKETDSKEPILLQLDLADLHSIRKAAEEFLSKEERLDILFNNAHLGDRGVMVPPLDLLTAQGYDLQFGTNVLGHYFFTIILVPALERSTAHHKTKARVINTSSSGHELAPGPTGLDWKTMKGGAERDLVVKKLGSMTQWKLYGASKMGNVLLSNILLRYHGNALVSCSVHPGGLRTDLLQHTPRWQQWMMRRAFYPAPYGTLTPLWAASAAEAEAVNGKYLIPWARVGKANPRAANEKTQDELKKWMEAQIKGF